MGRLKALLTKEFIQMRRDRLTFAMIIGIPVIQLLIFGFAINTEVKHLPTAVFDQSLSREGRELLDAFVASGYFDVQEVAKSYGEMNEAVESGRCKVGIALPPDFASRLGRGEPGEVQVVVDASDSMSASSAIAAAQMLGMVRSQRVQARTLQSLGIRGARGVYDVRVRSWYNPDFVSSWYMVPGILGMILIMTLVMVTSMAIVRERELGTLEQLLVTPVRPWELLVAKIVPYIFMGYAQTTLALAVGVLVFRLPVRGSLGLFYALMSFYIVASLALGILISSAVKTQMQAMQLSFFIFLPSVLLSGFMFPREAMPPFFRALGALLPITHFLVIARGIILKGLGISFLWAPVGVLLAFIVVVFTLSVLRFHTKLE